MPNVNTWHHRGGMGDAQIVYEPDGQGGVRAVVLGQDAYGNDQILPADAPWWGNLLQQGIYATSDAISGGRNRYPANVPVGGGAAVSASVSPTGAGVGLGLSSNTLLILGVVAAVFLLGKGRR